LPYLTNIWDTDTNILYIIDEEIHGDPILTAENIVYRIIKLSLRVFHFLPAINWLMNRDA